MAKTMAKSCRDTDVRRLRARSEYLSVGSRTYLDRQHDDGQSSGGVDVRLEVVDQRRVTTLHEDEEDTQDVMSPRSGSGDIR